MKGSICACTTVHHACRRLLISRKSSASAIFAAASTSGYPAARLSLVAAVRNCALGVDLEAVRADLPLGDIAALLFNDDELRWLRACSPLHRPLATTLLWSAKEALLKATGVGIAVSLHTPLLDGLNLAPLLGSANELAVELPAGTTVRLRHGFLQSVHLVMAAVTLTPTSKLRC